MKGKKWIALLTATLMLATTAVGCSSGQTSQTTGGGSTTGTQYKEEIIIAMADEFTTIDPMETTAETNQIVQDCTHDLLTDTNLTTMQNEGELLESWEMITPDHWTFKLKENVTFHDGTILNVDDVEFTFQRATEKPATANYMSEIKEFNKIDDLNFEIYLNKGNVDCQYSSDGQCHRESHQLG